MKTILPILLLTLLITGCSHKYYIVRHAEKAQPQEGPTMQTSGNPDLSSAGQQRAYELKDRLKNAKIVQVYSTNTTRTRQTAEPTATFFNQRIKEYSTIDSLFLEKLKSIKGNTLIVGHSNTVDDLVNGLMGTKELSDLPDSAYDNLFIITKKGKRLTLEKSSYGQPSK